MKIKTGDITNVDYGIIVQQVNAQGVMGSGVALAIKKKYPEVYKIYSEVIDNHRSSKGLSAMGLVIPVQINPNLYIANIVGQQFFGKDGKKYTSYDALDTAFKYIFEMNKAQSFPIHVPLIGSGLGGGSWPVIKSIIQECLKDQNVTLWLQPGMSEPSTKEYNTSTEYGENRSCGCCDELSCICYTRK